MPADTRSGIRCAIYTRKSSEEGLEQSFNSLEAQREAYAPNDSLLKTLLFANVNKRIELNDFLAKLEQRYGIVFGDREAERVLSKGDFDKKAFRANSRRLEQRLGSLGVLKRLSDACAYVINPYH
jgi:hypothetical protein